MNRDIIEAVSRQLAIAEDNWHRARASFGRFTATRASTLAGYESEVTRWKKALAEAENRAHSS